MTEMDNYNGGTFTRWIEPCQLLPATLGLIYSSIQPARPRPAPYPFHEKETC
jgi:hypothetical protein